AGSRGYCSVTTGLNSEENVTPKPATGARTAASPLRSGICGSYASDIVGLLGLGGLARLVLGCLLGLEDGDRPGLGRRLLGRGPTRRARRGREHLPRQRRHGVPAREGVEGLWFARLGLWFLALGQ